MTVDRKQDQSDSIDQKSKVLELQELSSVGAGLREANDTWSTESAACPNTDTGKWSVGSHICP